jgi:hypothetical protein
MSKFSFVKGFGQVQYKDVDDVRSEIMVVFGINNRTSWADRLNGRYDPTKPQYDAVEAIFHKRGITDIWG